MPELLKSRNNQVCQRLDKYCEECARTGSTDCIDHGGPPSEDTSVLGKRMGHDAFDDFMQAWGRDDKAGPLKPLRKRPIPALSKIFSNGRDSFSTLFPKVVTPTRPTSSSGYGVLAPAPKLASPMMAPPSSSFGFQSPPKFIAPIKPAASVPATASVVVVPNTETATETNTPSDHSRDVSRSAEKLDLDNDDNSCKEGGVRFRENLGKYVVEYRPPRYKWKLWMGTYATIDEGRRACDCARFYAGQDKGGFYFKDSPALFNELGPLNRPFSSVCKDVKDKAFNVELKKRAKQVIRKVLDAQKAKQPAEITRPTVTIPFPDALVQQVLSARTNAAANLQTNAAKELQVCESIPSSSQESPLSSGVIDPVDLAESDLAEQQSSQQEVASAGAVDAADPFATLDPFTNPGSLPESILLSEFFNNPVYVPTFPDLQFPIPECVRSSLDLFPDDPGCETFVELWQHEC